MTNDFFFLKKKMISIGLEGSANKLGIGIIEHNTETGEVKILANIRHTHVTPPGTGFLPKDTAAHHREHIIPVIKEALKTSNVKIKDIDVICYTKGKCQSKKKGEMILI